MSYRCETSGCRGNAPCAACRVFLTTEILQALKKLLISSKDWDVITIRNRIASVIGKHLETKFAKTIRGPQDKKKEEKNDGPQERHPLAGRHRERVRRKRA